jgi:hypothetical protein
MVHYIEVAQLLAKVYVKYGLSVDEFIVLNAYCMHSEHRGKPDFAEMGELTEKTKNEIISVLKSLYDKDKIVFNGEAININVLWHTLNQVLEGEKTIAQRLADSIAYYSLMGGYDDHHLGMVELIPVEDGGVAVKSRPGQYSGSTSMWSKEDMLKLSEEIREFCTAIDQDFINHYNEKQGEKRKLDLERAEERYRQRQEEKKQREIPKPGYVILIRYSNGLYKFTYTTSLSLPKKLENIRFQEGDTVQIIHTLEIHDTLKFYHKFLKTQFSNRGEGKYYRLTDEDVQYIRDEKFPSNAMEWFEGSAVEEIVKG